VAVSNVPIKAEASSPSATSDCAQISSSSHAEVSLTQGECPVVQPEAEVPLLIQSKTSVFSKISSTTSSEEVSSSFDSVRCLQEDAVTTSTKASCSSINERIDTRSCVPIESNFQPIARNQMLTPISSDTECSNRPASQSEILLSHRVSSSSSLSLSDPSPRIAVPIKSILPHPSGFLPPKQPVKRKHGEVESDPELQSDSEPAQAPSHEPKQRPPRPVSRSAREREPANQYHELPGQSDAVNSSTAKAESAAADRVRRKEAQFAVHLKLLAYNERLASLRGSPLSSPQAQSHVDALHGAAEDTSVGILMPTLRNVLSIDTTSRVIVLAFLRSTFVC
jgi:hypothetical protein